MSGRATTRTGGRPFPVSRHRPTISSAGRSEAIPTCPKESDSDTTTGPDPPLHERKEGDLIIGLNRSATGTLVERTSRFTMLLHLPRMAGHDLAPPIKNGPPLAGHGAAAVRDAITEQIGTLPTQLRRSLTWDQGSELSQHVQLRIDSGLAVYFCDPHSPWQRGTNENTNGLLQQYFPKGTDLSRHSVTDLDAVANVPNGRPRKTLNWKTPAEALNEHLHSLSQGSVATTP